MTPASTFSLSTMGDSRPYTFRAVARPWDRSARRERTPGQNPPAIKSRVQAKALPFASPTAFGRGWAYLNVGRLRNVLSDAVIGWGARWCASAESENRPIHAHQPTPGKRDMAAMGQPCGARLPTKGLALGSDLRWFWIWLLMSSLRRENITGAARRARSSG